jgi:hypothetical protein
MPPFAIKAKDLGWIHKIRGTKKRKGHTQGAGCNGGSQSGMGTPVHLRTYPKIHHEVTKAQRITSVSPCFFS